MAYVTSAINQIIWPGIARKLGVMCVDNLLTSQRIAECGGPAERDMSRQEAAIEAQGTAALIGSRRQAGETISRGDPPRKRGTALGRGTLDQVKLGLIAADYMVVLTR